MSLHGEVKVNGEVIAEWSARRLSQVPDPEVNEYDCIFKVLPPGTTVWLTYPFTVSHKYGDGAAILAAEVLDKGGAIHRQFEGHTPSPNYYTQGWG